MFVSVASTRKPRTQYPTGSYLSPVQVLLERAIGPLQLATPEERAFSLAVELNDERVAGVSLGRVIARHGARIPLSLRGLWLQVGMALCASNERAAVALLDQIAGY